MIVLNINAAKYIIMLFKGQAVLLPIELSFEWIGSFGGIKAEIALMFIFVSRLIAFTFLLSQSCALFKFQIIVINPLNVVYTIQPSPKGMSQHFSSHSWCSILRIDHTMLSSSNSSIFFCTSESYSVSISILWKRLRSCWLILWVTELKVWVAPSELLKLINFYL